MPNAPDSPSALEKDPRPEPLFEGNPAGEGIKEINPEYSLEGLMLKLILPHSI